MRLTLKLGTHSTFNGGCFLNDPKSKRQVIFSYLHYGGLIEPQITNEAISFTKVYTEIFVINKPPPCRHTRVTKTGKPYGLNQHRKTICENPLSTGTLPD